MYPFNFKPDSLLPHFLFPQNNRIPAAGRRSPYGKMAFPGLRLARNGAVLAALSLVVILSLLVGAARADGPAGFQAPLLARGNALELLKSDSFTGAATASIPVDVPPGRGGLQPGISINYSSSAGNSEYGYGWFYDPGSIERSTKNGVPRGLITDTFTFNGEDLVRLSNTNCTDTTTMWCYHTKQESFLKIQGYKNAAGTDLDYWVVYDKSGTKYEYGTSGTADGAAEAVGKAGVTRKWGLRQVTDTNGNTYSLTYMKDATNSPGALYPDLISYTGGTVDFVWESGRPDVFTNYRDGGLVKTYYRLDRIDVKVGASSLLRRVDFTYTTSSASNRSLLIKVQEFGSDGATALPARTFEYSTLAAGGFTAWTISFSPCAAPNGTTVRLMELNGDGLPDVVDASGAPKACLNNGNGTFTQNSGWTWGGFASFSDFVADFNGDGLDEPMNYRNTGSGFETWTLNWPGYPSYTQNRTCGNNPQQPYTWQGGTHSRRLIDLNGDGLVDLVDAFQAIQPADVPGTGTPISSIIYKAYLNNGDGTFADVSSTWAFPPTNGFRFGWDAELTCYCGGTMNYQGPGSDNINIADFNQDGLDEPKGYRNTGSGFEAWVVSWPAYPMATAECVGGIVNPGCDYFANPMSGDDNARRMLDINGDGLPDFVDAFQLCGICYTSGDGCSDIVYKASLNKGDGTFADITASSSFPANSFRFGWARQINACCNRCSDCSTQTDSGYWSDNVIIADFNGDGFAEPKGYKNKGAKPDLLKKATTGLGGSVSFAYQVWGSSGDKVPMPVMVVSSTITDDGLGSTATTSYSYSGGYWKPRQSSSVPAEFRGFEAVTVTDPAGNKSITHYYQGDGSPAGDTEAWKGQVNYTLAGDGSLTEAVDSHLYAKTVYAYAADSTAPYFAPVTQVDSYAYEGTTTPKQSRLTYTYDAYGNVLTVSNQGEVCTGGCTGDESTTTNEYVNDTSLWMLGKLKHTYMCGYDKDAAQKKFREAWNYYDNAAFGSLGTGANKGNLTKTEAWNSTPAAGCTGITTPPGTGVINTFEYDSYGNVTKTKDGRVNASEYTGYTSQIAYDPTYNTYVTSVTDAKGFVTSTGYDSLMRPTSVTDPNSQVTKTDYDVFGRVIGVWRPDVLVDDFSSDLSKWNVLTGNWVPESGELSSGGYATILTNQALFSDFTYSVRINVKQEGGEKGLVFRAPDAETLMGYWLLMRSSGNICLYKVIYDTTTLACSAITLPPLDTWFTLKVEAYGPSIKAYLNDQLVISTSDATYLQGKVGLYGYYGHYHFDNVQVQGSSRIIANTYYLDGAAPKSVQVKAKDGTADGLQSYTYVDGLGRTIQTKSEAQTAGQWTTADTYYDNRGLVQKTSVPYITTSGGYTARDTAQKNTAYTYDPLGRPTQTTYPDGTTTTIMYYIPSNPADGDFNNGGRLATLTTNANGKQIRTSYNGLGLIEMVTEWNAGAEYRTRYKYNTSTGELVKLTDQKGNVWTNTYDTLGRKTQSVDPDMGTWSYTYDANGNLKTQTDAKGYTTAFTYDALNRILYTDYALAYNKPYRMGDMNGNGTPADIGDAVVMQNCSVGDPVTAIQRWVGDLDNDGTSCTAVDVAMMIQANLGEIRLHDVVYVYDTGTNGAGRLTSVRGDFTRRSFTYDSRGRVTAETLAVGDNKTWLTSYGYDSMDRVTSVTYPDGEVVNNTYNAQGLPATVAGTNTYLSSANYNAFGRIADMTFGNNVKTAYDYYDTSGETDASNDGRAFSYRLKNILAKANGGSGTTLLNLTYQYDAVGNVKNVDDGLDSGKNQSFGYDDLNRLTSGSGVYGSKSYTYNEIGNILTKDGRSYTYSGNTHRVANDGTNAYAYDANGNITARGSTTFAYDYDNVITSTGSETYTYDQAGTRIKKVAGGVTTYYVNQYYEEQLGTGWEFTSGTEGWTYWPNCMSGLGWQSGGFVGATITCGDPYMHSGTNLGVDITNAKIIKVRLKNSTASTVGQIYFITNADTTWNEAKHKDFAIVANSDYTEYTIDMSSVAGWTGTLYQLRLDPEGTVSSGSFSLDYIRIPGASPTTLKYYYANGQRIAVRDSSGLKFIHSDHLGSASKTSNTAGALVNALWYDPWGTHASGSMSVRYTYTGKEKDATGLYYYGARYYDPVLGRFTTPDSLIPDPYSPQTLNRYAYVLNNPVRLFDPSGHVAVSMDATYKGWGFKASIDTSNWSWSLSGNGGPAGGFSVEGEGTHIGSWSGKSGPASANGDGWHVSSAELKVGDEKDYAGATYHNNASTQTGNWTIDSPTWKMGKGWGPNGDEGTCRMGPDIAHLLWTRTPNQDGSWDRRGTFVFNPSIEVWGYEFNLTGQVEIDAVHFTSGRPPEPIHGISIDCYGGCAAAEATTQTAPAPAPVLGFRYESAFPAFRVSSNSLGMITYDYDGTSVYTPAGGLHVDGQLSHSSSGSSGSSSGGSGGGWGASCSNCDRPGRGTYLK